MITVILAHMLGNKPVNCMSVFIQPTLNNPFIKRRRLTNTLQVSSHSVNIIYSKMPADSSRGEHNPAQEQVLIMVYYISTVKITQDLIFSIVL